MSFFARPNLDDTQFKQLEGSLLTLSGQTQIATPTGLTLTDGSGGDIIVTASGASINNQVLTYDSVENVIKLKDSSGGGSGVYSGASPTTCEVGGMTACTDIFGCSISDILQTILVPNVAPILVGVSATLSILPSDLLYEVGTDVDITATTNFGAGCIDPLYVSGGTMCVGRSCGASGYTYSLWGIVQSFVADSLATNNCVIPTKSIQAGNNTIGVSVCYSGGTQPYYSDCTTPFDSACSPGSVSPSSKTICGIYPIYYGKQPSGTRPPVTNDLITGGTKSVEQSSGTVTIDFSSVGEYTWFAIPSGSTSKTCWYVNASNNGPMVSSTADKYPDECIISVNSGNGCWSGIGYKVYMSKTFWTDPLPIEFRNS